MELKPCPFCGSSAKIQPWEYGDCPSHTFTVECSECGVDVGWYGTPEEAIAMWEQRA